MAFPVFEKKAEIPKGFEDDYEEKDGKWHPKPQGTGELEKALTKLRDERKEADKALKEAEDGRADLQRKLTAATSKDDKGEITKALAKFDDDLAKVKETAKKREDELSAQLRKLQLDDRAKAEFIKAGGRPERADAMLKLNDGRLDLADGRVVILDKDKKPTTEKVEDFFTKTYKTEMPDFYQGTRASGGGAAGGAGGGKVPTTAEAVELVTTNPGELLRRANEAAAAK